MTSLLMFVLDKQQIDSSNQRQSVIGLAIILLWLDERKIQAGFSGCSHVLRNPPSCHILGSDEFKRRASPVVE